MPIRRSRVRAGGIYYCTPNNVLKVKIAHHDGIRWHIKGVGLNLTSGKIEAFNCLARYVGEKIDDKELLRLRESAIKRNLSPKAIRFLKGFYE